jgi:hypothetical protein
MSYCLGWVWLFVPVTVAAEEDFRPAALRYVAALQDPATGAFRPTASGQPGLRATSGGVRATKYLGGTLAHKDKVAAYLLECYHPDTGGFAEPGSQPTVPTTAVGIMAAIDLDIPRSQFAKAMTYLQANAKSFEEVRIGAGAVEAWGVADCPFDLDPWTEIVGQHYARLGGIPTGRDGGAREAGSIAAYYLRLGQPLPPGTAALQVMRDGQLPDGGWGQAGATTSDAETTYRVMRAFMLMKKPPTDPAGVRKFLASCRNPDGGFGVRPGEPSSISGVYFAAIISKWLEDLQ